MGEMAYDSHTARRELQQGPDHTGDPCKGALRIKGLTTFPYNVEQPFAVLERLIGAGATPRRLTHGPVKNS
jgi:hypothetical protein